MVDQSNLKKCLPLLSTGSGVYLLLNNKQEVLYVGKARNLKKRVSSYFRRKQSSRIALLMQQVSAIETTTTETENQALLLESNLIKALKPRYNILLRDDKSFPFIILSCHQSYPRLSFYRGARLKKYRYFGPYPSIAAVRESLNLLQKLFKIRSCQDSFFRNRSRPCLQYQIKRCTAPCVALITPEDYKKDVEHTVLFLEGKSQAVIEDLVQQMETAAAQFDYESAARLRDQISSLREIQQKQVISTGQGDLDIFGLAHQSNIYVLYVMQVRGGRLLGGKAYFPRVPGVQPESEVLSAFIAQFYLQTELQRTIPVEIVVPKKIQDQAWLVETLVERAQHKIKLSDKVIGERRQWLKLATENAKQALGSQLSNKQVFYKQLENLQAVLQLDSLPQRLECFDISHSQGEATVASCVVFDPQGPRKMDYRRFNIEDITPGDDYAAIKQALRRRYRNFKTHEKNLPDILLIDGGKGQLKQAEQVLEELQITGILLMGVAKGAGRKPGLETLFLSKGISTSSVSASSIPLVPEEANFLSSERAVSRSPNEHKQSLRTVIQEENRDSPLENLHRERKRLEMQFRISKRNGYISKQINLSPDSLALHAIQQIRDEAHRFAITGHRGRRAKKRRTSPLESIPGIGKQRRRELLRQFGGLQALQSASAEDIAKISGISRTLAERIYFALKA